MMAIDGHRNGDGSVRSGLTKSTESTAMDRWAIDIDRADITQRRRTLPSLYNRYQRTAGLDGHDPADDEYWPVFRPLHLTGWLIADQLAAADHYGAAQVLVTAASSKTALGFAHSLRELPE